MINRKNTGLLLAILVLLFITASFTISSAASKKIDWENVDTIDIYADGIGDFLSVDYSEFISGARKAYDAKEYEKAAKYYLVVVRNNTKDSNSIYNLACCYGLLGADKEASFFLEKAVNAGFTDINHIKRDIDFDKVRDSESFKGVMDDLENMAAEKQKESGELRYFDAKVFMQSRVHLPDKFDASKPYPLVVGLHGLGDNPEHFVQLWKRFGGSEFIFMSPQGPYAFSAGNNFGYSWTVRDDDKNIMNESIGMTSDYIKNVIETMKATCNITDVYLMGFSQGCAFTYVAGIENHKMLDGLICFGGWLDEDWLDAEQIGAANHLKVFIAHGKNDTVVDPEGGKKAYDTLKNLGYDVQLHEFDGGHSVPEEALKAASEWFGL